MMKIDEMTADNKLMIEKIRKIINATKDYKELNVMKTVLETSWNIANVNSVNWKKAADEMKKLIGDIEEKKKRNC